MESRAKQISLLDGEIDNYDGVTVNMEEPMSAEVFTQRLRASLSHWRDEGKKGIWIKLPIQLANLVEAAVTEGFRYHHAEPDYLMLVSWISPSVDTIPANASHVVGVGALVFNKKTAQVLVVQERGGRFRGTNVWKLPTGVINEGEDICDGVVRELEEETGIIADFVEVLSFRQSHNAFLKKKSDLFFLCVLTPRSYEITKQNSEILDAKWMPIQEYIDQPFNQKNEMFKFMADISQKKCEDDYLGFSIVPTSTSSGKKSFLYCNADHANRLKASRDQASTSL
ncbi:PREDICTED: nudix hydrolase 7-like [Camelina sativa]|uniref:Nudix hydrolase n=1 Tax=Camelina sativa TaxID=90675 RepID=A0ABM0U2X8_CAMSA|nr:PREDICTED: nudix hydrolase 7-like [Camelina sativa]XP_010435025.1 PREDICTED: nudix hydrolase 7-like [Camelina sativa]XP_010435026.1 PREDICTED: nudix hydrolase 7-like [Camelina sativa]XP_010435027.1 PREDICTED: nudix hydrolase 7-like [Camelina sativa]XP_010435028.1 PREDICTED: nudix hydrolase 7-like [Camelina sativa]XP_010435029.1 PREDICTED: nudix hydrolase 7-like [Camelina sativa]